MKPSDEIDEEIAVMQGKTFAYAAHEKYDMYDFIVRFMHDPFTAQALDAVYSPFQLQPPHILLQYMPFTTDAKKSELYANADTMWWIGYAYRLLCRKKAIPSRKAVECLTPGLMADMYPGFHTIMNSENMLERLYSCYRSRCGG